MNKKLKVAAYQLSSSVADFTGNSQKIIAAIKQAKSEEVDLLIFPELAISGYFPMDLVNYSSYFEAEQVALADIAGHVPHDMLVILGSMAPAPANAGKGLFYNQAVAISGGQIIFTQNKTILANNDVFFEPRYFQESTESKTFTWQGLSIGLVICEDLWHEQALGLASPSSKLVNQGATIIVALNASPYQQNKQSERLAIARSITDKGVAFVYANSCGAQDDLVFEGSSILMRAGGSYVEGSLAEDQLVCYYPFDDLPLEPASHDDKALLLDVIIMAIKGYARRNGFKHLHLGLSGGIDSALVAALAVRAMGHAQVTAILMPSKFSSEGSLSHSLALAQNLGIETLTIPIIESHQSLRQSLVPFFAIEGLTDENLQARIRGLYLMAYGNQHNSLLLTTSNKSELATGYGTLYGDMCGGFNPIGDLYKTEVFALARYINETEGSELIPSIIIEKAPSAELRDNQSDQQSLPPYDLLDALLYDFIEKNRSRAWLVAHYTEEMVNKVLPMVVKNEFKRFQSPPILKLSKTSFGKGRMMPLSRYYKELD